MVLLNYMEKDSSLKLFNDTFSVTSLYSRHIRMPLLFATDYDNVFQGAAFSISICFIDLIESEFIC